MGYEQSHPWLTFRLDLERMPAPTWVALGEIKSTCLHLAGVPLAPEMASEFSKLYLAKGAMATTAIEGNTLSEEEVRRIQDGRSSLPPSKAYLEKEVHNILKAFSVIDNHVFDRGMRDVTYEAILAYNRLVLDGLDVARHVTPGAIRRESVGVGGYRGCPVDDCEPLLKKLCRWLAEFQAGPELLLPLAVIKAILAHLYLAWIHPFGDGNGRTARLVEYHLLLAGGVPHPAAQLPSNFYNQTRAEYYRQLERSSQTKGDVFPFLTYAVNGFLDGLREQIEEVKRWQQFIAWRDYVYERFRGRDSEAERRRRRLVLDLGASGKIVAASALRELTPRLAAAYAGKGKRTLSRDMNTLEEMGLLETTAAGVRARSEIILAFLPRTKK